MITSRSFPRPPNWLGLFGVFFLLALPTGAQESSLPPVITRYEELLLRSPEPGTAFEKICEHFQKHNGLETLATRWELATKGATPEEAATYWILTGLLADRRGDSVAAGTAYERAAEGRPKDYRVWLRLADYHIASGKLEPAAQALEKAIETEAPPAVRLDLFRQLATARQRLLDPKGALAVWAKMAKEFPQDPDALEEMALAQLDADEPDAARACFEKLQQLVAGDAYRQVRIVMHLGAIDEEQNRIDDAIARYEDLLSETSETSWMHREVRRLIEDIYRRQDDLPGLATYYERRLAAKPSDVQAAAQLADVFFELNRRGDGLDILRNVVASAPDRTDLRLRLAERLLAEEQPDEAAKLYEQLVEKQPTEPAYWEMLGTAQWAKFEATGRDTDRATALASWQRLAPDDSTEGSMILRLADVLTGHGLNEEARTQWERALAIDPNNNDIRERLASNLREDGESDLADAILTEMITAERAVPENFLRVARLHRAAGNLEEALTTTAQGLTHDPEHFELLSMRWALLGDTQQWEAALTLFELLLAAAPNDYFITEIENRYLVYLQRAEQLQEVTNRLSKRLSAPPSLEAKELRLLARIALHTHNNKLAANVFAAGREAYQDDATLAHLEAEHHHRRGDFLARAELLQRLLVIQPERRAKWLGELARNWADAQQWDKARAAIDDLLKYAPASAEAHTLSADILFSAGQPDEAVQLLRQAIRFSQQPNTLRLRLARHHQETGKPMAAIRVLEEAFANERDATARLSLMKPLTEAYFQDGRLGELVESFERRQRAEAGGWHYALYLAAIHTQTQDYTAARKQLSRALADRSRDPDLLRQLLRLAEAEGNVSEQLRYQQQLTRLEPSLTNRLDLIRAEVATGNSERALALIRETRDELLERPMVLRELVITSGDPDFAASLADVFSDALQVRPGDWAGRLALAEFHLADGNKEAARATFEELLEMNPPEAVLAQSTPQVDGAIAPRLSLAKRLASVQQHRAAATAHIFGNAPPQQMAMLRTRTSASSSLDEAHDIALFYLAMMALERGEADTFITQLKNRWEQQDTALRDRLMQLAIIESRDELFNAIEAYVNSDISDPELDVLCTTFLRGSSAATLPPERLMPMLDTLFERMALAHPAQHIRVRSQHIFMLERTGHPKRAQELADKTLANFSSDKRAELVEAFGLACRLGRLNDADRLFNTIRKMPAGTPPRHHLIYLALQYHRLAIEKGDASLVRRLTKEILDIIEKPSGSSPAPASPQALRAAGLRVQPRNMRYQQEFPGPNEYVSMLQSQWLKSTTEIMRSHDQLAILRDFLKERQKRGDAQARKFAQVAEAYVQWWSGLRQEAAKTIARARRTRDTPAMRLTHATMLVHTRQGEKARKLLAALSPEDDTEAYIDGQFLLLVQARQERNPAAAEAIGKGLLDLPLTVGTRRTLLNELRQFGLAQLLQTRQGRAATTGRKPSNPTRRAHEQLTEVMRGGDHERMVSIARRILTNDPRQAGQSGLSHLRRTALRALDQAGQLDAYRQDIANELEASPQSTRFHLLLSEAWRDDDASRAADHLAHIAALRPRDLELQRDWAHTLLSAGRDKDATDVYDKLLQRDAAQTLMRDHHHVVRAYADSNRLESLITRLASLPVPSTNTLPNRQPLAGALMQIGKTLERESHTEAAIAVWAASAAQSHYMELDTVRVLTNALLEKGRDDEVLPHIEKALFPALRSKAPLFSLHNNLHTGAHRLFSMSFHNHQITAPVLTLIRNARLAGGLDQLLQQARTRATSSQATSTDTDALLTLLRVEARDPALLEDAEAWGDLPPAPSGNKHLRADFSRLLASRLLEWPAASSLALRLLHGARKEIDNNRQNFPQRLDVREDIVDLALCLGQQDTARDVLREINDVLVEQSNAPSTQLSVDKAIQTGRRMIELNMITDATRLADLIGESSSLRNNVGYQRLHDQLVEELQLIQGKVRNPQCVAWLVDANKDGQVTIAYEIGADRSDGHRAGNPHVFTSGREYPKLNGRYHVELLFGTSSDNMRRLALLKQSPSRGIWTGKLPAGAGYIRTLMRDRRDKDARHIGLVLPVVTSPNKLTNPLMLAAAPPEPCPGWAKIPGPGVKQMEGGPVPGGRFVQLNPSANGQNEYLSDIIPLEPGLSYYQTAWLRTDRAKGQQNARLGRRYLDASGRVLSHTFCPVGNNGVGNRWQWFGQELRQHGDSRPGSEAIPRKAVAIQVVLNVQGGCDLNGLYLAPMNESASSNDN